MSDKDWDYTNPDNLPVESVTITVKDAGMFRKINAIDPYWADKRQFPLYEKPPSGSALILGALDVWKAKTELYLEDVKGLLSFEYHRFWSTIIHNERCMDMLVSFLQEANPPYLPPYEDRASSALYQSIRKLVLVVFCRLVTNKERKNQWMSKEYMRDLIYDKFIFTMPILWDICLVYGEDNLQNVGRLLESVFTLQPKYAADLDAAIAFVKEVFKYITIQVNPDYDSDEPPNLPETFKGFSEIRRPSAKEGKDEKLTLDGLRDLVLHLLDTALTLRIFVEAYPKSIEVLKKRSMVLSIVQLYEYAIPHLYETLEELTEEGGPTYVELSAHIDSCRAELIDIFREMLAASKNAIFSGEGSVSSHVEQYLSLMLEALSERLFIKDYDGCYPVRDDVELLRQACPNIDTVKTDFILQAIYSNLDDSIPDTSNHIENHINGNVETIDNPPTDIDNHPTLDNEIPNNVREQSLISEVKDILPHLGDGFIQKCLKHYGYNAERVINSILEDNLADSLKGLDRNLPIIPEDPVDKKFLETGIERLNVFDGDEFDIMTRDDVDVSRIHLGKKREKYKNLKDLLNDKSDVKMREDIYSKYNLVCDEEDMYSDEYDDTWDGDAPPPTGDVTNDERRLNPVASNRYEESSSSDSEVPEQAGPSGSNRNKLDFCQNPEEIRAKREAYYRLKQGKGQRPPPRNADVVGKPKGHGQEKEVLVNRDRKNANKSSRANHNRRSGAQWKRTQGMVPS